MEQTLHKEVRLLAYSILLGIFFAFLYDQFLVSRRLVRHPKVFIILGDFVYLLICFFVSFQFLFYGNDGILRMYMIIGCFLGITLYLHTIGRVYQDTICRLICTIMSPIGLLKKRLTYVMIQFTMKVKKYAIKIKREGEKHAVRCKKKNKAKVSKKKK